MSFFKAPSWAKALSKDDSDGEETTNDLFSHSKDFLAIQRDRLEQERLKKERAKQKGEERDRKRKEKAQAGVKRESPGTDSKDERAKKRRINSEESARLLALVGVKPIAVDSDDEDEEIHDEVGYTAPMRTRTRRTRDIHHDFRTGSKLSETAEARGESGDSDIDVLQATAKPVPLMQVEEDEDSDPEIAALQRRAREKHRLKKLQLERNSSTPGAIPADAEMHSGLPTPPPPDPIISLLITSEIPGTKQLLVKRKLTQDLGTARRAWCQKQGFEQSLSDQVFFTWNGRRMYDSTTCQRLGLEVDATGAVVRTDQRDADGAAQVHVVATTQEQLDNEKAEQVRQTKLVTAHYEAEEDAASGGEEAPAKVPIKIVVQAKSQRSVRITVFSTTRFSKIVNYAKKRMGLSAEQPAYLSFDGDRLDPDDVVGDTDMDDMENVDLILGD